LAHELPVAPPSATTAHRHERTSGQRRERSLQEPLSGVKTHIAHIYRKLGVSSRRAAIRRAAELELF